MHDGVEVLLEVDALGQAVRGDQQPPLSLAELLDLLLRSSDVSSPVTTPTVTPLKRAFEVAPKVVRSGDVAAEHDRIEPSR